MATSRQPPARPRSWTWVPPPDGTVAELRRQLEANLDAQRFAQTEEAALRERLAAAAARDDDTPENEPSEIAALPDTCR